MTILNILYLEDDQSKIDRVEEILNIQESDYGLTKVKSASEFLSHWNGGGYDAVLASAALIIQSDPPILNIVRQGRPNFPFLVMTDLKDENLAKELQRLGATNQLSNDQIHQLPNALLKTYLNSLFGTGRGTSDRDTWIYQRFAELSQVSLAIADIRQEDCPIIYCNAAFEDLTGYSREEVIGKNCRFLQRGDRNQIGIVRLREAIQERKQGTAIIRNYKKDGTLFWNEVNLFPLKNADNQITHFMGLQTGVSNRVKDEITSLMNQEIFDNLIDGVYLFDSKKLKISFANGRAIEQTQYDEDELLNLNFADLFSEPMENILGLVEVTVSEERTYFLETNIKQKTGREFHAEVIFVPVHFPDRGNECLAIVRDVTQVFESEVRLHQVTDNIPGMVYQFKFFPNGEQKFVFASAGVKDLIGFTSEEVVSNYDLAWGSIHPHDVDSVLNSILEAVREKKNWGHQFRVMDREGNIKWLEGKASLDKLSSREAILTWNGFLFDITSRIEAEQQVAWLQKMESMGKLAGGIAHDYNNQLFVIMGNCEYLLKKLEPGEVHELVEEINLAASRSAKLTKQLLAFSRRQMSDPVVVNLGKIVETLKGVITTICKKNVSVEFDIAKNLHNVKVDVAQIEQVMTNLIINAKDAMPNGGTILIKMENLHSDGQSELDAGDWVIVSVCDSGTGIPDHVRDRIFEPFFTTKARGKGTGLGLSTSYGLVKQAGGHLLVESEINRGSTFKICLQRCTEKSAVKTENGVQGDLPEGNETILVVDDEEGVRRIIVTNLKQLGYHVLEAKDGSEAIQLIEEYGNENIHLMVTDILMPNIRGDELIEICKKKWPHIKYLAMSGYTSDKKLFGLVMKKKQEFLYKPFSPSSMALKIREMLDS